METIGARLRFFAENRYGSVAAMERAIGMAKHLLHKYVRDESKPGAELLQKFRGLGMSIDWLLSGEGEMMRSEGVAAKSPEFIVMDPKGLAGKKVILLSDAYDEIEQKLRELHEIVQRGREES